MPVEKSRSDVQDTCITTEQNKKSGALRNTEKNKHTDVFTLERL